MTRLVLVGDVGGHLAELATALVQLGADLTTPSLPEDVHLALAGDLIHRGPDSLGVLTLVDELLQVHPEQVSLVAGNHEAQYLFPPRFGWPETLHPEGQAILRRWWTEGSLLLAASFETQGEDESEGLLLTHAGLTAGLWERLGSPDSAARAADLVNALRFDDSSPVYRAGTMLGLPETSSAGVLWAEAASELYASWNALPTPPPFSQAHGHSSPVWWDRGYVSRSFLHMKEATLSTSEPDRLARTQIRGRSFFSLDPGHGTSPAPSWSPLVLTLA